MNATTPRARAVVVYESMFGNTEKVAAAIARGLRSRGYDVLVYDVRSVDLSTPVQADLLVVGAPTHAFSLSRPNTRKDAVGRGASPDRAESGLREWLVSARLSPDEVAAVAAFDTRVGKVRRLPIAGARTAAKIAHHRGLRIAGRPNGFAVDDVEGPLCDGELERAEQWGKTLADVARREPAPAKVPFVE